LKTPLTLTASFSSDEELVEKSSPSPVWAMYSPRKKSRRLIYITLVEHEVITNARCSE
jgi:hypothetical protein